MKVCVCGNPNCDSPFHEGDKVEVQWGSQWVPAIVVREARTRVTVRFSQPLLFTQKTIIVIKNFWGRKKIKEEWKDEFSNEITLGAAYVRFPKGKSWERSS